MSALINRPIFGASHLSFSCSIRDSSNVIFSLVTIFPTVFPMHLSGNKLLSGQSSDRISVSFPVYVRFRPLCQLTCKTAVFNVTPLLNLSAYSANIVGGRAPAA